MSDVGIYVNNNIFDIENGFAKSVNLTPTIYYYIIGHRPSKLLINEIYDYIFAPIIVYHEKKHYPLIKYISHDKFIITSRINNLVKEETYKNDLVKTIIKLCINKLI